ncbi:MAG TPA: TIGR01777 family oxidoreductase [Pirellulales bacterium]
MHIAITGASGLIGTTLVPLLTGGGHQVTRLVRRAAGPGEATWDPAQGIDPAALETVDAVVHLAGENIAAARWSAAVKQRIRESRVRGTRVLCEALAKSPGRVKVLVCASAIGFYGHRGDEELTEESAAGEGFLAEVVRDWEAATDPARAAGMRVVNLRFGVILSSQGGALAKMLLPFKLGAGGRVGTGRQYWSWISIDDAAGAIVYSLMTETLSGPVNAVAPRSATNREFTKTLGRVLRRPTFLPMPAFAARLALGEMADDLLLASTRVVPRQLERAGYVFRHPALEAALRHVLGVESR